MDLIQRTLAPILQWNKGRRIRARLPNLSGGALTELRRKALDYAERLRIQDGVYGRYRYKSGGNPPLLYASVFAVLLRHLTGDLLTLTPEQRAEWVGYVSSYQSEDGLFRDPLVANEIASKEDWWGWRHLTLHCLMALHALGARPRHPLCFLEKVSTRSKVRKWLERLDWQRRASYTSNTVQNYGGAMQYARDLLRESSLGDAVDELLGGVEERCDAQTALWGSGFPDGRLGLSEGVQAGYHFWSLYWYEGREIPYGTRAFESIVRLQNRVGGFSLTEIHTSACEDIDALDPLVRLAIRHPSLKPVAVPVVYKGLRWVLYNFNPDGGASFQRSSVFRYGHDLMLSGVDESSIFATWFRVLTVAYCCELLKEHVPELAQCHFYYLDCPGLQFSTYHRLLQGQCK